MCVKPQTTLLRTVRLQGLRTQDVTADFVSWPLQVNKRDSGW